MKHTSYIFCISDIKYYLKNKYRQIHVFVGVDIAMYTDIYRCSIYQNVGLAAYTLVKLSQC